MLTVFFYAIWNSNMNSSYFFVEIGREESLTGKGVFSVVSAVGPDGNPSLVESVEIVISENATTVSSTSAIVFHSSSSPRLYLLDYWSVRIF